MPARVEDGKVVLQPDARGAGALDGEDVLHARSITGVRPEYQSDRPLAEGEVSTWLDIQQQVLDELGLPGNQIDRVAAYQAQVEKIRIDHGMEQNTYLLLASRLTAASTAVRRGLELPQEHQGDLQWVSRFQARFQALDDRKAQLLAEREQH